MTKTPMEGSKIKIALIGVGGFGSKITEAIKKSKNLELVFCFHPVREKAEDAAKKFGCAPAWNEFELLSNKDIAGIVIATPNGTHYKYIKKCIEAGKHIFVEKPITETFDAGLEVAVECARKNLVLAVGHNMRRNPAIRKLKELADAGKIGQMVSAEINMSHGGGMRLPAENWRLKKEKCLGGSLMMLGVHSAEVSNYLFGPAKKAGAIVKKLYSPGETEDTSVVILELARGGVVYLCNHYNVPATNFIKIYGTKGVLFYNKNTNIIYFQGEDVDRKPCALEQIDCGTTDTILEEMEEFGDCIRFESKPETGAKEALNALAVAEAALISQKENRFIEVRTAEIKNEEYVKIHFRNINDFWKRAKLYLKHRKPLNYAVYRYEWFNAPKENEAREFPIHLGIEPTNSCNLRCVFCARHNIDYKFGFMDFEVYKKIIDEGAEKGLCSVKLVRGGESLLHPQFPEMIKYAREKGILDILLNTNATLLTEDKALEIIKAAPDLIIFSVDAPDREIYESQRVGANYDAVERNIKRFIDLKNKLNSKITTRAHMVYTPETKYLIPKHIARWQGIVDEVTHNKASEYKEIPKNKSFRCRNPWRRLDITWDGSVYACDPDMDPKGKLSLGNVKEKTLEEMWKSPLMEKLRDNFKKQDASMDPCKFCRGT